MPKTDATMFSGKQLLGILLPLMLEQTLAVTIGLADLVMVSSCGEAAVSGISLVDSVNHLFLWLFPSVASGGAVILAQYLGAGDAENARCSTGQLTLLLLGLSLLVTLPLFLFRESVLRLLFGKIEKDVMACAGAYFSVSVLSYPFLAFYNVGAAVFRSRGNTRVSMAVSAAMNVLNVTGNAVLIYGCRLGALGAGIASLASRILGAAVMLSLLLRPDCDIGLWDRRSLRFRRDLFRRILSIAVPSAFESSAFNLGKLLVVSTVSTLPTSSITANAVLNTLQSIILIPTSAIHLAAVPVVGQCLGAEKPDEARHYASLLVKCAYLCLLFTAGMTLLFRNPVLSLFHLSPETLALIRPLLFFFFCISVTLYPLAFTLTPCIRAAGDAGFCMVAAMTGMWIGRIVCSRLFVGLGLGLFGVWLAVVADWLIRILFFVPRYLSGRWLNKKLI